MYNSNLLLKATKEIVKQFNHIENMNEDTYRKECIKAIQRAFETDEITSEFIMYLSEGDCYVYPRNRYDFTVLWDEEKNKITARVRDKKHSCNVVFEFNANTPIDEILDELDDIGDNFIL